MDDPRLAPLLSVDLSGKNMARMGSVTLAFEHPDILKQLSGYTITVNLRQLQYTNPDYKKGAEKEIWAHWLKSKGKDAEDLVTTPIDKVIWTRTIGF